MATFTHDHLYVTATYACITGPWTGEEAVFGLRFANGGSTRPGLNDGQINLNTFDCHTTEKSRSLTIASQAGTVSQIWEGDTFPDTETVTDNDIDFFLTKMAAFAINLKEYIPSPWRLTYVKLYAVNNNGRAPLGPCTWTPAVPVFGTTGSYPSPENACCISLYTANRTKIGRGRIFFGPLTSSHISSDGTLATTLTGTLGNEMQALQNSVRTRGTPGASAVYAGIVKSRKKTHVSTGPGDPDVYQGTGCVINKIRVGDEVDHQERRTKSRPETYTNWSVT